MATAAPVRATNAHAAQQSAAAAASRQMQNNLQYLRSCYRKQAVCPPASGAGINQPYALGQTLIFDVPTAQGGWLESFLVQTNVTVTFAAGTSAVQALTKAAMFGLFDSFQVEYGAVQQKMRPYWLRPLRQLTGYGHALQDQGVGTTPYYNLVAGRTALLKTATPGVATGANTWIDTWRVPLRYIPRSPAGMLPIQGDSTRCQFKLICPASIINYDPLLGAAYPVSGTGQAATVSGTVSVIAEYRDGSNMLGPTPLTLDMGGIPTCQVYQDRQLNPLTAGTILRQRIDTKLQHLYVLSCLIDGVQSTDFATDPNITALELDQDFAGQNSFYRYGVNGSNLTTTMWPIERFREGYGIGQDLDQGILPWVPGPYDLGDNPDNLEGASYLNMMSGGWPDASYGVQVTTATTTNMTPRVETIVVCANPVGLVAA